MDGGVIVLLLTPILLPVVSQIGVDPVFFGIIMCTVCCVGILTPPVGVAMYIVCGILKVSMKDWTKESIPFLLTILLLIVILILFPRLVTFLPNVLYG
jgi:TRAP-type C4-dicarboxylate transport system permease large subunit